MSTHTHLAIAALIGRHWPASGRHALRLAYSRVLLDNLKLSKAVAVKILETACRLGGSDSDGQSDVVGSVESTLARLDTDRPATGAASVWALLPAGGRIVSQIRRWLGKSDAVEEAVHGLNERYAVISVGNKTVVMETRKDGGIKELWPFDEFRRRLIKERVRIKSVNADGKSTIRTRPLANIWLEHRQGRQYDQLKYAMPGSVVLCDPDDYNGWLGFAVEPAPGDWSKNRDHLLNIICNGIHEHFDWVMNWCAALVQQPGRHAMAAIILRGGQGIGKGYFADQMLGSLFHDQQYLHIIGANQLTAEFNEHLSGKVLIFADESTWGGDPKAGAKLKGLVTEDTVPIHRKFLKMVEEPSALHIVIASNNEWPVPIDPDDRRFTVLDVGESRRQDDAYFAALRNELAQVGRAAFLHELLAWDVDQEDLRHPLRTAAKREVAARSLGPIHRWWYEKLQLGRLLGSGQDEEETEAEWPMTLSKSVLHSDYLDFVNAHYRAGRDRRSTETELGQFFQKHGLLRAQRRMLEGVRQPVWDVPTLAECRTAWSEAFDWPSDHVWGE
jgi:hypothetical protein